MEWNILIKNAPEEFIYCDCALKVERKAKQLIETIIIYMYFGGFIKIFQKILENKQYGEK